MTNPVDGPELLYSLAAPQLTKILTLQDRNPHSPTYGCFDRNYWHLRIMDFPSGMAQEFVLPLALAYAHAFTGNPFYRNATIREWVRAGIAYAAQSGHADGSCDDYYPFEKASGATAFSLYAILQAIPLVGLDYQSFLPFLERRGNWLAKHRESGRLSNHEALIANCLFRLASLIGRNEFTKAAQDRLKRLLTWQSSEGWFYEYQGCDPGYLTLTIANMVEIDLMHPDLGLRPHIASAVRFLVDLQPPDGWLGGEWTSRNTNNYFPHGFELCGSWLPNALMLNNRALPALQNAPDYSDDHIIAHHCWSYLLAATNWRSKRPVNSLTEPVRKRVHYPEAGYLKITKSSLCLLASMKKGGSFRLYDHDRLLQSDTGVSVQIAQNGKRRTLVSHLWSETPHIEMDGDIITISGEMGYAKSSLMTPIKMLILRILMLSFGRFKPDLIRQILQKILITGKKKAAFHFHRKLTLDAEKLIVKDKITGDGDILSAGIGAAQFSIYTVMSGVFHPYQLQPWDDITTLFQGKNGNVFTYERVFKAAS